MSDTIKKYAVTDAETCVDRASYESQAPATTLAKRVSHGRTMFVEERTYVLTKVRVVRRVLNGAILK